jgi:hypothetical protein
MLWNCPHCQQPINQKTLKMVKLEAEGGRRALQCPHCSKEVEMNVNSAEYWQLLIMLAGLPVLWWASKTGSDFAMIVAGIVVAAGIFSTLYIKKRILGPWKRFRAPAGKAG